jgi:hypothetical protein
LLFIGKLCIYFFGDLGRRRGLLMYRGLRRRLLFVVLDYAECYRGVLYVSLLEKWMTAMLFIWLSLSFFTEPLFSLGDWKDFMRFNCSVYIKF